MASDLYASLKPCTIEDIFIGGQVYSVPALAAHEWLGILCRSRVNLWAVVPGLLQPDASEAVMDLMLADAFSHEELEDLVWELVGIAAGRDWWTVLYLIGNATADTNIDVVKGKLALHGVDATRISLAAWLDAVYMIFVEAMNTEQRQRFDIQLRRPPPGVKPKIDRDAQRRNFAALMGAA